MNSDQLQEITDLLRQYLLQEHSQQKWIFSSPENYEYFKQAAKRQASSPQVKAAANPSPSTGHVLSTSHQIKSAPPAKFEKQADAVKKLDSPEFKAKEMQPVDLPKISKEASSVQPATTHISKFKPSRMALQQTESLQDIRKIIQEKIPQLAILDLPPNDEEAKSIQQTWKNETARPQIILLSHEEPPRQAAFLKNLAKALEVHEGSAGVIRIVKIAQANGWKTLFDPQDLKLVIASQSIVQAFPEIDKYIGKTPIHLLSDLSLYLKDPKLKSGLWKALRELLDHSKQV